MHGTQISSMIHMQLYLQVDCSMLWDITAKSFRMFVSRLILILAIFYSKIYTDMIQIIPSLKVTMKYVELAAQSMQRHANNIIIITFYLFY